MLAERQGQGRREVHAEGTGDEAAPRSGRLGLAALPAVVERRIAIQAERELAADPPDDPHDLVLLLPLGPGLQMDGHEVHDLADAFGREEPGDQDVRVGQVHLAAAEGVGGGGDPEGSSAGVVEDRAEDAGRVEMRKAEPVDRPVQGHQRDRVEVADDAVVLDGRIAHPAVLYLAAAAGW